jgi:hypothetical protein
MNIQCFASCLIKSNLSSNKFNKNTILNEKLLDEKNSLRKILNSQPFSNINEYNNNEKTFDHNTNSSNNNDKNCENNKSNDYAETIYDVKNNENLTNVNNNDNNNNNSTLSYFCCFKHKINFNNNNNKDKLLNHEKILIENKTKNKTKNKNKNEENTVEEPIIIEKNFLIKYNLLLLFSTLFQTKNSNLNSKITEMFEKNGILIIENIVKHLKQQQQQQQKNEVDAFYSKAISTNNFYFLTVEYNNCEENVIVDINIRNYTNNNNNHSDNNNNINNNNINNNNNVNNVDCIDFKLNSNFNFKNDDSNVLQLIIFEKNCLLFFFSVEENEINESKNIDDVDMNKNDKSYIYNSKTDDNNSYSNNTNFFIENFALNTAEYSNFSNFLFFYFNTRFVNEQVCKIKN